jgi:hypothetical protein
MTHRTCIRRAIRGVLTILTLLFCGLTVRSEVIVYQGSARAALDAADQFSPQPRVYLVFDQGNQTMYGVFYFKLNGQKKQFTNFPLSPTHYNPEQRGTKSIATFSLAFDNTFNLTNFVDVGVYLRGNTKEVLISTSGAGTKAQYPTAMTGVYRLAQRVNTLGTNFEFNLTLSFDPVHTR